MVEYSELMQPIKKELEVVSKEIKKQLKSEVVLVNQVANYIIDSGGKRLRPALVLLMAKVICSEQNIQKKYYLDLIKMACVIEFIHTATLLHDDVVDESGLRRSKETAFSLFGSAPSVLVGDFLYSRAFQIMVEVDNRKIMEICKENQGYEGIADGPLDPWAPGAKKTEGPSRKIRFVSLQRMIAIWCVGGGRVKWVKWVNYSGGVGG